MIINFTDFDVDDNPLFDIIRQNKNSYLDINGKNPTHVFLEKYTYQKVLKFNQDYLTRNVTLDQIRIFGLIIVEWNEDYNAVGHLDRFFD